MKKAQILSCILIAGAMMYMPACREQPGGGKGQAQAESVKDIPIPAFNGDSAYQFVAMQLAFGPRVPGTPAHEACAAYLERTLKRYAHEVTVQQFQARAYDNNVLSGKNIIASFQPEAHARITLAAHWDSRPFADHDPDPAKRHLPVMGANDGASGVGILLELARLLSRQQPKIGVDIVLFDLEDYGPPQDDQRRSRNEYWGLGSQYWSSNPHVYNYRPRYAVLLDMVGAADARFPKEGFSMDYAPDKVNRVWDLARSLGYGDRFPNERGGYINDDHYFINTLLKIPAIDIIHLDPSSSNGSFYEYWHTTGDTMDKIDRETLLMVGKVVLETIFRE